MCALLLTVCALLLTASLAAAGSDSKGDSFTTRLVNKIVDNLQVVISSVRILKTFVTHTRAI